MKTLFKNTVLIIAMALMSQSCAVDLEEDLSSIISIEDLRTEDELVAALSPMYQIFAEQAAWPQRLSVPLYGADDLTTWWGGNKAPLRVFDKFDYGSGENAENAWLPFTWDVYWKVIYYSNNLIESLKSSSAPADAKAIADGEARFWRAFCYFNLVRSHGNMPIILDGHEFTGDEARATVLLNYNHIEEDLLIAESALPAPGSVSSVGRASSAAAKTLLSELYLTWAGWPVKDDSKYASAATKSKEVIDLGYFELLPIDELWLLEGQNSRESVFSIQFSASEDIRSNYSAVFSFHESRGWSDGYPELRFFNDFPEGARKDATFYYEIPQRTLDASNQIIESGPPVPWQQSQRFHPMYKKFTIAEDLTIGTATAGYRAREMYRYAEVLLIYAEAQAHLGGNSFSIEALNQVKRRAAGVHFLTPDPMVDVSSATPNEIIDERGWELAGERKRWFDLVRSERVEEIAARRDPSENIELIRQPTKNQYIVPIPFKGTTIGNLKQNPEGFVIE